MEPVINYTKCPACGVHNIHKALTVKDHMISQQAYDIWECAGCTLRFTQAVPPENEIGKYYRSEEYISHTDIQKGFVNRLYHLVRRHTLKKKRKLIESIRGANRHLLDVGAGTGAFADHLVQHGWRVTGVEADAGTRKKAYELYRLALNSTEEFFDLPPGNYTAITMWHVLEHVHRLHEYLQQLKLLLAKDGVLFIAVPNYTSYDAAIYKEHWAAYDVPRHLYHFSPTAMRSLLQKHELKLLAVKPMWFDSFYVSLLSEKYKTGKGNIVKGFFNGVVSNCKTILNKERCSSLIYVITK